ncbi:phospholipid carrier-dependent glycosyltransferase [Candidatus Roizmanbacteria bacterium]|nr:phospholipid carrier-dependent glycosyltransferase [Candidatus Roizmanbacteria bacterium]
MKLIKSIFEGTQRWEKLFFILLMLTATGVYFFDLSHNGYANSYYAAAVQAASTSWKAFFFGSLDGSNFITVDKPPMAIWIMALSARIFGFSSWSMLAPNALSGVITVGLVYATVRRIAQFQSAALAGIIMLLSPVAALMFRFNNPDGFLTMFLTASAYTFLRAFDSKKPVLWLSLTAIFTGCAFNTKMLQGLILLPVMVLLYLIFAPVPWYKRIYQLFVVGIITIVATLWWTVAVSVTPVQARPYIGSSSSNSVWDLITGYNGLSRILGNGATGKGGPAHGIGQPPLQDGYHTPPPIGQMEGGFGGPGGPPGRGYGGGGPGGGSGPGGTGFGGKTGALRIFNSDFGPNIGWFLPAAALCFMVLIGKIFYAPRMSLQRTATLFWFGWLALHIGIFSIMSGVIHPYYVVVLAPAIAALVGLGLPEILKLYNKSENFWWILPALVLSTTGTSVVLLNYGNYWPLLTPAVLWGGILASGLLIIFRLIQNQMGQRLSLCLALCVCLASPFAFTFSTITTAHTGSIPTSGPGATAVSRTNNESASADKTLVSYLLAHRGTAKWIVAVASANESAPIQISGGAPVMAVGGFNGSDNALTVDSLKKLVASGQLQYYLDSDSRGRGGPMENNSVNSWVKANGTIVNYGGTMTLYKLSIKAN